MNKDTGDCDCSYMVTEGNERAVVAVLGLLSLLCIITTIAGTVLLLYPRLLHNCLQKLFSRHVSIDETLYPDKDGATDYSQTYRSFSPGDPDEYMYEEKDNVASCMATYRSSEQNWPDQENYRQRYRIDSVQDNRSQPFSPGFPEESMFEEKDNATSGIAAYRNSRSPSPFPDRIWLDQDNLRQGYVIDTSMQDDRSLSPLHKRKNIEPREAPSNINTSRMRQPSPSVWLPPSSSSPIQSLRPPLPEEYSMRSLPRLSSDLILREPSPSFHDKILRETSPSFHDKILREPSPSFHDKILREPSPSFRDKNLKAPSSHDVKSIQQLSPKLVRTSPSRPRSDNQANHQRNYQAAERSRMNNYVNQQRSDNQLNQQRTYQGPNILRSYRAGERSRTDNQFSEQRISNNEDILPSSQTAQISRLEPSRIHAHLEEDDLRDPWWADDGTNERSNHLVLQSDIHTLPGELHLRMNTHISADRIGAGINQSQADHRHQGDYSSGILKESHPLNELQMSSQIHHGDFNSRMQTESCQQTSQGAVNSFGSMGNLASFPEEPKHSTLSFRDEKTILKRVPETNRSQTSAMMSCPKDYDEMYIEENFDEFFSTSFCHDVSLN